MDIATREKIYELMLKRSEDPETTRDRHRRAEATFEFALEHEDEWRLRYPDHYVAAYDCRLVAAAQDVPSLYQAIEAANVPLIECHIRFLSKEKYLLML